MIDDKSAEELVETVFNFDYVGDAMMALRKNLEAEDRKQRLVKEVVAAATAKANDNSVECIAVISRAAEARVQRYVNGAKAATGTGCGS
jgi:acyl-CoA reductase-like NAD-dependent aldehyde dehydrogenase